jgi:hypothetical protein
MTELNGQTDTLRYLDADQVEHPSGTFAGHMLCSQDDEKLGSITGMLVEPATRRVRYFVIARNGMMKQRRYLLPADSLPVLRAGDRKLCVLAKADDLERFDARQVERFSDEDAITAIFARPAA